jgi:hypothetical protein
LNVRKGAIHGQQGKWRHERRYKSEDRRREACSQRGLFDQAAKALGKPVPQAQWDMPAGFLPDGQVATLKEIVDPKVSTLSLAEVSPEQRAELVVKRIERQPDSKVTMFPAGVIDKD